MQAPPMGFKEPKQTHRGTSAFMSGRSEPEGLFPPERGTTGLCSQPKYRALEQSEAGNGGAASQSSRCVVGRRHRVTHHRARKRAPWEEGASAS